MAKGYSDPEEKPYRRHPGDDFWVSGDTVVKIEEATAAS